MQTRDQQAWIEGLSQSEGEQCLVNLCSLADQLRGAMDAIVQRSLSSLHDSLHLQEIDCSRLADLRHRSVEKLNHASNLETACVNSDLAVEIKAATDSLLILNRKYSALLHHSGDTLRLLAGLYRGYRGFTQPASESRSTLPTWSCDI